MVGISKLQILADAEALGWFRRSIEVNRNYPLAHFWLATALALLGSPDQARAVVKAGLALDPTFTVRRFRDNVASSNPTFSPSANASVKECAWPGSRRGDVPSGSKPEILVASRCFPLLTR